MASRSSGPDGSRPGRRRGRAVLLRAWELLLSLGWGGSVVAKDALRDGHRGEGLRPAGVEGQVGDRLDQLLLGDAVVLCVLQVERELLGVAAGGQRGDGDEAAVARRQLRALPRVAEECVIGEVDESGCEVAEHLLRAGRLLVLCHVLCLSLW